MGTFHHNTDELHGYTVVIRTHGAATYIGRWDHEKAGKILLLGATAHNDGDDGKSTDEFLKQAALWGFQPASPQLIVAREEVADVKKLGDLATELRGW